MSHAPGFPILLQHAYTEAEWAADNPVLMDRETGWTTDTRRVKLGDGVTAWNDLPYAIDGPAGEVDTVAGVTPVGGDIPEALLKTALDLPTDTVQELADEAALARNADNLTSGTVADARIAASIARDSEVAAAVAAEAALARNADNLDSGTVDDARLTARLAGIAGLGLADGQLLEYDTATGLFIPANPTGNSELAVAENITTAVTALSTSGGAGTIVAIPFTAISISNSNGRPVTLEFQASFLAVTNAGVGTAFLLLYETTGAATPIAWSAVGLPNAITAASQQRTWPVQMKRIGVVSTTRTFELRAYLFTEAGDNANASVINGTQTSTILRAVAG